jgi:hypothetical protein
MPQPRFDELRERLLRAGIAPRHVRRYIGELRDHFDDLVREETAQGSSRDAAELSARARLGRENDLAEVMLERPELRSLTARYPWAVFGIGPVVMVVAGFAAVLSIEVGALNLISHFYKNPTHQPPPAWFMMMFDAWNALPTLVAPLAISGLLCVMGARQRISSSWIFAGVAIACVLGAFHSLSFVDTGYHGELGLDSGLLPPFPRELVVSSVWRAAIDLTLVAGVWRLLTRRSSLFTRNAHATA